ncbi:MAG: Slp family lipoprotein [Gammaproteobacteria bacterium]
MSLGRFLVSSDGFLDPATYSAGREVTVYGILENVLMRNIGEPRRSSSMPPSRQPDEWLTLKPAS